MANLKAPKQKPQDSPEAESISPTVLIVDDDPSVRLLLRRALERDNYSLREAANGRECVELAQQLVPDLILLDAVMPEMDGFEAYARLQEQGLDIPVLIITGLDDEDSIKRAFSQGVQDFVPKPVHWAILRQKVARLLHQNQSEKYIAHLAYHDPLTGLPNRQLFMDRCGTSLSRARRSAEPVALLFVDLDRFKQINDTLGHGAGDIVLQQSAERLVAAVREGDTVARLGGDEFTILLEGIRSPKDVAAIADKILAAVEKPIAAQDLELNVSASIGIALYPDDGQDITSLLQNADSAMYRAKQQGRANYQFHAKEMSEATLRRLLLTSNLHKSLARQELALYYQPRIGIANDKRKIIGMETLLRWNHPEFGLIYPGEFIPLAEEMGLMVPIGEWVLREACNQGVAWLKAGYEFRIAINVSSLQFKQRDLLAMLKTTLRDTGFPADRLELELTENVLLEYTDRVREALWAIHGLGIHLALDDYGTGYSSLKQLCELPISSLIVDRSLVKGLPEDKSALAVVQATVAVAKTLNLRTVAEGVEDEKHLELLLEQGYSEFQGFLFGRPAPPDEVELGLATKSRPVKAKAKPKTAKAK